MGILIIGLIIFLGVHSISIVAPSWRDSMATKLGHGWQAVYSIIALVGFALIIYGYGTARSDPMVLYTTAPVMRYATAILMLFVFPLFLAAYLPGRIKTTLKHPLLVATKIWAFAHLLSNGMLADVLLFGGFLIWAVADRISLKRRTPRIVPALPATKFNDIIAVVVGIFIYALFLHGLHTWLIGIPIVFPG